MNSILHYLNKVSKERGFRSFQHATDDGAAYVVMEILDEAAQMHVNQYASNKIIVKSKISEL